MTELFLEVFNRSISASFLVLAILGVRFLLRMGPKWANVLLWGLVAVRLISPFSLESALSLIPSAQTVQPEIMMSPSPAIHSGIPAVNQAVNPIIQASFTPDPAASANPLQIVLPVLSWIWGVGILSMALYCAVSCWLLHRRVCSAERLEENLYQSSAVPTPFVIGLFRPRIYLPRQLPQEAFSYVIAHEKAHIARRDPWWKFIGFALLSIHWFNPVMYLAYSLLCRDIEYACDERVIRDYDGNQRANYSQALLDCSVRSRRFSACPLAFGETEVKARVKGVLSYKKPGTWLLALGIGAAVVLAVCFLTNPVSAQSHMLSDIINQNGYQITGHTGVAYGATIPKEVLDADELAEGKSFGPEEVRVARLPGCRVYLDYIGLSPEDSGTANIVYRYVYAPYEEELGSYGELYFPYIPAMYYGEISAFMNQQAMYHTDLQDPDFQQALKSPRGITVSTTVDASRIQFGLSFTPLPNIEMYILHYVRTDDPMPLAGKEYAITDLTYSIPYISAAPSIDGQTVQCRVDADGHLWLSGFLGGGEEFADLGALEETQLTRENFDDRFSTEFSASLFREKAVRAWKCAWDGRFVYLILDNMSNVFLAYGAEDTIQYLLSLTAPSDTGYARKAIAMETTGK